jgi:hypothetical protein
MIRLGDDGSRDFHREELREDNWGRETRIDVAWLGRFGNENINDAAFFWITS